MNFKSLLKITSFALFISCNSNIEGTVKNEELISSKGEKIYINSLNWGVTDDSQITSISNQIENLKITDTIKSTNGFEPFIYKFERDTLKLYFKDRISYSVKKKFNYIRISYYVLNAKKYNEIYKRAIENNEFHTVPKREKIDYPEDMPKAPK
jgi:hypothetical protein